MFLRRFFASRAPVFATAVVGGVFLLSGCDEHVHIPRDREARLPEHASGLWRPQAARAEPRRDSRPVTSRDVIGGSGRPEAVSRESKTENDILRDRVKNAIANDLAEKGLRLVSDPDGADILV